MLLLLNTKKIEILQETSYNIKFLITDKEDNMHLLSPEELKTELSGLMIYEVIMDKLNLEGHFGKIEF